MGSIDNVRDEEFQVSPPRTSYVVGLAFDEYMNQLALIYKMHGPPAVVGRWNGIGGLVEIGETPVDAMVREFQEETGVFTNSVFWTALCVLEAENYDITFYWTNREGIIDDIRQTTDEPVAVFDIEKLPPSVMPNLVWMIAVLCDRDLNNPYLGRLKVRR